jgi:hypothetical protein
MFLNLNNIKKINIVEQSPTDESKTNIYQKIKGRNSSSINNNDNNLLIKRNPTNIQDTKSSHTKNYSTFQNLMNRQFKKIIPDDASLIKYDNKDNFSFNNYNTNVNMNRTNNNSLISNNSFNTPMHNNKINLDFSKKKTSSSSLIMVESN